MKNALTVYWHPNGLLWTLNPTTKLFRTKFDINSFVSQGLWQKWPQFPAWMFSLSWTNFAAVRDEGSAEEDEIDWQTTWPPEEKLVSADLRSQKEGLIWPIIIKLWKCETLTKLFLIIIHRSIVMRFICHHYSMYIIRDALVYISADIGPTINNNKQYSLLITNNQLRYHIGIGP